MTTKLLPFIPSRPARYALVMIFPWAALLLPAAGLAQAPGAENAISSHMAISKDVVHPDGDLTMLLQKIVDLPELQQYYSLNQDNQVKPLVVMQHGVSFPARITVFHNSHPLLFKSKKEAIIEPAYFLFWRFDMAKDKARVEFSYIYKAGSPAASAQKAELVFDKTDNLWTITSSNMQTTKL